MVVGTSLGTATSIHLASRHAVGAMVLQGSFASALRTLCPDQKETSCMDQFRNVDKIVKVNAPTLFVHGDHDKLFTIEHVYQLRGRCPGAEYVTPLFIEGGEHVDFDRYEEYWRRLYVFVHQELEIKELLEVSFYYQALGHVA